MHSRVGSGKRALIAAVLLAVAFVSVAMVVDAARVKPFLPPCLFHEATGLHCPGCGGTRAVAALLQGRWIDALHDNVLFLFIVPFLLWTAWRAAVCVATGVWRPPQITNKTVTWTIAAAFIAFFVLRNIPVWPFTLLAPLPP